VQLDKAAQAGNEAERQRRRGMAGYDTTLTGGSAMGANVGKTALGA